MRECGVAVIRGGDGRILISRRKEEDSFGGYWEFPGGGREEGETLEACAEREVMEELGVIITADKHICTIENPYPGNPLRLVYFLCRYVSGEPQAIDCAEARWVASHELDQYKFPPANQTVIDELIRLRF
ncbi:MAG: 8-oxo-dGTP diphosphatase MutT [Candidatus Omnitrophica bacterium]|jgi:mutator protein MutT|nr:8-oxo-dGTP diphosphatase MutT [Candidatus Omnitrophota bacterium]